MGTVVKGDLLATLKAGELLARQIVDRNPELFADVIAARRDAPPPALMLPEPCLMTIGELAAYQRHYDVRIAAHLTGVGNGLSDQERAHAYEVGIEYARWKAALAHSYSR